MSNKKIYRVIVLLILLTALAIVASSVSATEPPVWETDFGTALNQSDDDCDYVPLGFSFDFYGVTYTDVWVNSNGNITFNGCNTDWSGPTIPKDPLAIIGTLYGDFDPGVNGDVYYNTLGTAPNRKFVVTWEVVPEYAETPGLNTFQVQLFEGSNEILFGYNGLTTDGINWNGPPMNVGISSGTGPYINSYSGTEIPALDGENLCYMPSGDTYAVYLGTCPPPPPLACPELPGNILQNSCFEVGEAPWKFYSNGWGVFDTATPPYDGYFSGRVEIGSTGSNIQLYQYNLPLEPNQSYKLYFAAKSSGGEDMRVFVHKHGKPYTNYGLDGELFDLTTAWEKHEIEFTTNSLAMDDGRLRFWLAPFAKEGTVYWFDNVYLVKVTNGPPPPPDPDPLEVPVPPPGHCNPPVAGNVVENPGFEASDLKPWKFYTNGKGYALPVTSTFYECTQSAKVKIKVQGNNVQLFQYGLELQPNTSYQLRLAAKSTDGRDVRLYLHKHRSPYTNYGLNGLPLDLTDEWQVFVVQFTTTGFSEPVSDGRLRIWLAGSDAPGAEYYFDDVVMVPLGEPVTATESLVDLQSFSLLDRQADSSGVAKGQLLISGYFIDDDDAGRMQGAFLPLKARAAQCAKAHPSHAALWPADGRMVNVKIVGAGKPASLVVTGIWQDEPVGAEADGVLNGAGALLRAERADGGNGRVYHVAFNATYRDGTICGHEVLVTVPLQKGAGEVYDDGPLAASTLP
jgi:hypothetical protein